MTLLHQLKKALTLPARLALTTTTVLACTGAAMAAEDVRIAGYTWPGYGFFHIAIAKDLAPELNIDYQTIEDPYESFNLVAADQMDVVASTAEFTPVGVERGLPIKLVAFGNLSYGTDKIVAGPGIASAADLAGKEVAVLEGGLSQIFMAMWLEQNGADFDSVVYRNIIADDALAAMIGGGVAASQFWEPYGSNTLKALEGSSVLAQSREPYWLKQGVVADGYYMGDRFINERRDVALLTMKALYDSIEWWSQNPEEGNQIIADGMQMSVADVELVLGKDGSRTDGGLYVYNFMEAAQFCGSAPGNPPFDQTNGQINDHWALVSDWWVKFDLIEKVQPPETGIECSLHKELYEAGYRG
ncbi:NitT/TauT family transport system substrate-binding protein [Roseovarius tolerans]|uniref:NitT/TauT family transport system substrate-binding protein n=1 Tax=Roseovarius tolerans TaxID=74031 RepID=A0A1H8IFI2_9RHOB|nr:ABC transporter substrate-binding protein [Roseovarius tolerans]SEN67045.1 NitT/TauT family transport system substrate-binding protein [Roseovarius tolerans]